MRLVTVETDQGPRACGEFAGRYVDLQSADPDLPSSVKSILGMGPEAIRRVEKILPLGARKHDPARCKLLPPVPDPGKIVCVGLNYLDHAAENKAEAPEIPIVFSKFTSSLIGHGDFIVLPPISQQVDYEAEMVVIIGQTAKHVDRSEAMKHVGGYTVGNDVSARDWQFNRPGKQWLAGKSFDTFAPVGPAVVTANSVPDPQDLDIQLSLNGREMQHGNTREMIFPVDAMISHLSDLFTLEPGDLIFTGTPPGVGMARKPPVWLKSGDVVEVKISGLGTLRNLVVAG